MSDSLNEKTLTLVRHAKSDWGDRELHDSERPLNSRGQRNAPAVAQWYARQHRQPEYWISSPAVRAYQTVFHFRRAYLPTPEDGLNLDSRLYEADILNWLQVLSEVPQEIQSVIAFGHNPGISYLLSYLCPQEVREVVTCTVLVIRCYTPDWASLSAESGQLLEYASPESLGVR